MLCPPPRPWIAESVQRKYKKLNVTGCSDLDLWPQINTSEGLAMHCSHFASGPNERLVWSPESSQHPIPNRKSVTKSEFPCPVITLPAVWVVVLEYCKKGEAADSWLQWGTSWTLPQWNPPPWHAYLPCAAIDFPLHHWQPVIELLLCLCLRGVHTLLLPYP